MRKGVKLLLILSGAAASLYAQESYIPTLGFKVGVPITDMFSARNTSEFNDTLNGSPFTSAVPRYEFGVSAEFHIFNNLDFEVDGIYKRGGFNSYLPVDGVSAYRPTTFNNWEIPGLFKYNLSIGHLRPFVDVGASLRHISTISQWTDAPGLVSPGFTDNSIALRNRNSYGGVAGIGITFKEGPLRLSPEVRYTRWANEAFEYPGLKTNLDQADFLLGIAFGSK
jgi:hypothetical protein